LKAGTYVITTLTRDVVGVGEEGEEGAGGGGEPPGKLAVNMVGKWAWQSGNRIRQDLYLPTTILYT
jgi:hypothetical protein